MTILCIETSTSICSAAIMVDGVPTEECIGREGSNHARLLPRYIEHLLQYAKEHHLTIDAVALSEGPGSYTGLRIGASTAKGLCYGLNIPLIPVSTLQLLAAAAKSQISNLKSQISNNIVFVPMIDARRMEVYTAFYDSNLHPLCEVKAVVVENEQSLIAESQFKLATADSQFYYFGDGAAKCREVIHAPNWHYLPDIEPLSSQCRAIIEPLSNHYREIKQNIAYYEPFYLKDFIAAPSHIKGLK